MIPIQISHHKMDYCRHTILIEARWFRSEITLNPSTVRWHWPTIEEWGPAWHELGIGRFSIDYARINAYDECP